MIPLMLANNKDAGDRFQAFGGIQMNIAVRPVADPAMQLAAGRTSSVESTGESAKPDSCQQWSKLCRITLRQMDRFVDLVPLVLRGDDVTAVNRMRVTCRRLEQMLELVYVKPRPGYIRKLKRRLKLYRHTLGKLRNYDALLALSERAIAANSPETAAWVLVRDYLVVRRNETARTTLDKLGHVNVAIPYLRMKRDLTHNGEDDAGGAQSADARSLTAERVRQQVARSLRHRWREFEAALERSQIDPCQHMIHGIRIAAKRLRYLAEVMSKLHMEGSAEALAWLKTLQRTIGIWHDLEILEHTLRKLSLHSDAARMPAGTSAHIDTMIRQNRNIKKTSAHEFLTMTRQSHDYQQVRLWVARVLSGDCNLHSGRQFVSSPACIKGVPIH